MTSDFMMKVPVDLLALAQVTGAGGEDASRTDLELRTWWRLQAIRGVFWSAKSSAARSASCVNGLASRVSEAEGSSESSA